MLPGKVFSPENVFPNLVDAIPHPLPAKSRMNPKRVIAMVHRGSTSASLPAHTSAYPSPHPALPGPKR